MKESVDSSKNLENSLKKAAQFMNDDFQGNFNFSNLLEKNEKKASKSPISNLLQSTTQTVVASDVETHIEREEKKDNLYKKIEDLERRFETKEVNEKFERLESLLQSIIINQKNVREQIELKSAPKSSPSPIESKDQKPLYIAASIVAISLIVSAMIFKSEPKAQVVTKEIVKPAVAAVQKSFHTPVKYLNLRAIPSTKGQKLEVVAPNTRVEILKTDGDWVQIKYKNYLKGSTHEGWVYDSKNLKSI
ncbi:SH3 domain protein [Bacteriovorax sp. BAL6_X]|uniref:SH3 domain-containing protein n=1 Tax=Bacteriovorax sp. BAL6_X TaxID=1201290 RepID=UPI0003863997|nr:SH3 domain-containing protein [Bacteriovorax sp. BAL6_X]EPZ52347.1 SH3 domain protein [Bacteriovorax sp. BAL6_X]